MSRKLQVTELESRVAPTVFTTIGQLLSMLPADSTLPSNMKIVGNLSPDQRIAIPDSLWQALQSGARR
ncbi:MAG: hypothetical protein MUC67_00095 [Acidobacteria bacterium]|jgi:hypothetical protein|nr:hypothetical protein [Acidobacteriota bacterium]